ncbi:endolytic transglycosylase MltG [Oribacterium sp. oral taxon 102]|uniref:endolytic transglycosylase MltG n=1 Tax=Oribacterium sp. oral taxon 102 TaxID=671214 RepID=UPI0015B991CF|nr:endolytic transglycosylase MltG [Oribacterium sp. oral taxon 102]NWO20811.1 endolytic transglycosylase MltG [Oribacterium sp. oral taxon 102]
MERQSSVESMSKAMIEIAWRVIMLSGVIYLTMLGITRVYSFGHGLLYDHAMEAPPGTDVDFEIRLTDDRDSIGARLQSEGLIDNLSAFSLQSRLYKTDFEPGSYTLNTSMTLSELLSYLSEEGQKQRELKEKKLVAESVSPIETTEEAEVIGGNEDVIGGNEDVS